MNEVIRQGTIVYIPPGTWSERSLPGFYIVIKENVAFDGTSLILDRDCWITPRNGINNEIARHPNMRLL